MSVENSGKSDLLNSATPHAQKNLQDGKLEDLQNRVREFCEQRDWDQFHGPKDLAIGLVTEGAELLDIFRFKSDEECLSILASPQSRERVEEELADVFFFILRFAQLNGIDLGYALQSKIVKNSLKYPVTSSRGSNRKYNESKS